MHPTLSAKPESSVPPAQSGHARLSMPTVDLLVSGGDDRIALDESNQANIYGCSPMPQDAIAAFGSSTASTISDAGFAAADTLRARLLETVTAGNEAEIYAGEIQRIRHGLIDLCGLSDLDGLDVVIGASGTDMHLIGAQLVCRAQPLLPLVVMVEAGETGSGVWTALAGRHFSARTTLGQRVTNGEAVEGGHALEVATVAVRDAAGMPRPKSAIDGEVERLVQDACSIGRRVLLILADVTKTGMIAPSIGCAAELQRRLGAAVEILVDACQFRIAASTLRAYLQHDFMVMLTGSKFITGPAFSSALMIPSAVAQRLRRIPLPAPIRAYSRSADWPADWPQAQALDTGPNFGLLLRWEAALTELRAFRAISDAEVTEFAQRFAHAVHARLSGDPHFEPLPVPELNRRPLIANRSWDKVPTIFPFLLRHIDGDMPAQYFSRAETQQVYRTLRDDLSIGSETSTVQAIAAMHCQLGQPVACGMRDGIAISALRLCLSARLIAEGVACKGKNADQVIARALLALDKVILVVDRRNSLAASGSIAAVA